MPPEIANAVAAAYAEWTHWGEATRNHVTDEDSENFHTEREPVYARRVMETYVAVLPSHTASVEKIRNDGYAWSGATVCYFMEKAGFRRKRRLSSDPAPTAEAYRSWVASTEKGEFPFSQRHSDYIRWSIRARRDEVGNASYWGYRIDEEQALPEVGDLVGYARRGDDRLTREEGLAFFNRNGNYQGHTDLVVARRAGEIDVIGGNVGQSVTKKTLALDALGRLADTRHPWFVLMKYRP